VLGGAHACGCGGRVVGWGDETREMTGGNVRREEGSGRDEKARHGRRHLVLQRFVPFLF
jgi:hypothetical protein